ncbi:sensor histidine kinase [Rubrobacter xylanophilus]|uniref:sensor histidine kinase n=1 Tax=Rubrobacter xylanophilus TaxID=49319 RepID=UPI001C63F360|nr:sensor histidine kinase [Rubrobacter xylanophilus]
MREAERERTPPPGQESLRHRAARVLEEHAEEIVEDYERRLERAQSLLLSGEGVSRAGLREQARTLLRLAAEALRGRERPELRVGEEISRNQEAAGEPLSHPPDESFRAGLELSKAALERVLGELDLSGEPPGEVLRLSLRVQEAIMDHTAREAMISHVDYLLAKLTEVQAEERRRLSRELHDRLAHSMALVAQSLELHEALAGSDPETARERLHRAAEAARRSVEAARNLARELRGSEASQGLELALQNLLEATVPAGVRTKISFSGDEGHMPDHVRDQLYMILREGIRNAVAHSETEALVLEVTVSPEEVRAAVTDHGKGFEASSGTEGVGLASMRERAQLLRGEFRLRTSLGEGTRVEVRIPLGR